MSKRTRGQRYTLQNSSREHAAQDKVMQGYRDRGAVRTEEEAATLHRFFSPVRVPKGMTNVEVRTILLLNPLRSRQQHSRMKMAAHEQAELVVIKPPKEFYRRGGRMTRKAFAAGVIKLLRSIAEAES